jgi:hypothetical protein
MVDILLPPTKRHHTIPLSGYIAQLTTAHISLATWHATPRFELSITQQESEQQIDVFSVFPMFHLGLVRDTHGELLGSGIGGDLAKLLRRGYFFSISLRDSESSRLRKIRGKHARDS